MAIIDLQQIGLFASIRKILRRDLTVYPEHPNWGAGFSVNLHSGIYQMPKYSYGRVCRRIDFYDYIITHTPEQQENRSKFSAAVAAWQALTSEQKEVYKEKSSGKNMSGYNYFLGLYMKTEIPMLTENNHFLLQENGRKINV